MTIAPRHIGIGPAMAAALVLALVLFAGACARPAPDPLLEGLSRAVAAHPDDGTLLHALAEQHAALGHRDEALRALRRLDALGWPYALLDAELAALGSDPAYRELAARFAAREPQVRRSERAFVLGDRELVPEGIAHDPRSDTFFVGSIRKRKIVAVTRGGAARDFVPPAQGGLLAVLGLHVDAARRHLYAATFASGAMEGASAALTGTAALFRYDADTGALLGKYVLPGRPGEPHLLNDVAVAPGGEVYVTDSEAGAVWRLRPGAGALEPFLPAGTMIYPNGIALSPDGARLFVAHFRGIARVDVASGKTAPLSAPAAIRCAGVDGLALHQGALVAVQNGLGRARITRYPLDVALDTITGEEILESGNPVFAGIPTTGVVAGGAFYYIANSQIRSLASGGFARGAVLQKTEILAVPLGAPRP